MLTVVVDFYFLIFVAFMFKFSTVDSFFNEWVRYYLPKKEDYLKF